MNSFKIGLIGDAPAPKWVFKKSDVIHHLETFNPKSYANERNHLSGKVSFLSPYISRGLISLPEVLEIVLKNSKPIKIYKYINELTWREYWQRVWRELSTDGITSSVRNEQTYDSKEIPTAVIQADTSINTLDNSIQALYESGYLHNHARMWIAGLTANVAKTWWGSGANWMYYHLYDHDLASNHLSWQWVAGTFSNRQYVPQQGNINKYSKVSQDDTFLSTTYAKIKDMDVPQVLQDRMVTDLKLELPTTDNIQLDKNKVTWLYHGYWLNPDWRPSRHDNKNIQRLLIFEPSWYEQHPVSKKVFDFMIKLARENLSNVKIYIGEVKNLITDNDLDVSQVHHLDHPIANDWPSTADSYYQTYLFPGVEEKFYKSFSQFWKQAYPIYKSW